MNREGQPTLIDPRVVRLKNASTSLRNIHVDLKKGQLGGDLLNTFVENGDHGVKEE